MEIYDLIERYSGSREKQQKAIFSTLFIGENRIRTVFDKDYPDITLKQFMLLVMLRQSKEQMTFTKLGKLLGCSRQNIKKLAFMLQQKGFVTIQQNLDDPRAASIIPTEKLGQYFDSIAASHEKSLDVLFSVYTDEEIAALFQLLMRLYDGIRLLEGTEA